MSQEENSGQVGSSRTNIVVARNILLLFSSDSDKNDSDGGKNSGIALARYATYGEAVALIVVVLGVDSAAIEVQVVRVRSRRVG